MCGIVGVYHFDKENPVREQDLAAMADQIIHRGPDDFGYHTANNVGIGMRRLSIIDLAGGHQPIQTADGKKTIVFNGELYNYREQAKQLEARGYPLKTSSDTEVVLGLYDVEGDEFLSRLNGMYGFAIHNAAKDELMIVRDRIGVKPVYYYQDAHKIVFASEAKAILAHPDVRAELDTNALALFFKYGYVPTPYTLFQGIKKLPPASLMRLRGREQIIDSYWDVSFANKFTHGEEQVLDELEELLQSAVSMQMVADVPLGAFLSGGLDSSGIVHLMQESGVETINTYSIGFGDEYSLHDETDAAQQFANDYETNHHAILVTPDVQTLLPKLVRMLDEPLADSSFVVTYLVSELAAETVKVILSGVGGDEIFGGYRRYLFTTLNRYFTRIPKFMRGPMLQNIVARLPADRANPLLNKMRLAKSYIGNFDEDTVTQYSGYLSLLSDDLVDAHLSAIDERYLDPYPAQLAASDATADLDKVMYFDLKGSLPEQLLMLTDKMTMAKSIEARVPYLDHRLVEFMARTPTDLRVRGFDLRYLQKKFLSRKIPSYVLGRAKKGFGAPFGGWIRKDLNEMMQDYLSKERINSQGLFDASVISTALADHLSRREDRSDYLLANLSFQIWHDTYLST
ncbi:MAG: asparagine synthase (glutamine-hydrolyzing) [Pseudomonadota bacterium]